MIGNSHPMLNALQPLIEPTPPFRVCRPGCSQGEGVIGWFSLAPECTLKDDISS